MLSVQHVLKNQRMNDMISKDRYDMGEETDMTRYEIKKKKIRQKRKMIIALSLIVVGLALVIVAAIMEAGHYPWGILFGTATQDADTIPDPSPIKLDAEDEDVIITFEAPSPAPSTTDAAFESADPSEASPSSGAELPGNPEDTASAPAVPKYVVLGSLKIPVLSVSQNLLEGAGKQMKYGVGHVPSTAAPGQKGNCAISGHRPYPFRYLDQLKTDDHIVIKCGSITYTYAVFESFDVLPTDVWVLNNIPGEDYALTLITCTPYMVSSHRLIVRARLIDIDGKSPQDYYGEASPEVTVTPSEAVEPGITVTSDVTPTDISPNQPEITASPSEDTPTPSLSPSDAATETPSDTSPSEAPPDFLG
jgi:sortase A